MLHWRSTCVVFYSEQWENLQDEITFSQPWTQNCGQVLSNRYPDDRSIVSLMTLLSPNQRVQIVVTSSLWSWTYWPYTVHFLGGWVAGTDWSQNSTYCSPWIWNQAHWFHLFLTNKQACPTLGSLTKERGQQYCLAVVPNSHHASLCCIVHSPSWAHSSQ